MDALAALTREPLDLDSDIPLYQQLKTRIIELIAGHAFDDGTPLPTEEQIANALSLSRGTVRRCFKDLVAEGRVVRRRGQGTFVSYKPSSHDITTAFNFTLEMGMIGKAPSSKVLSFKKVEARAGISKRLKVADGTDVWEIRRLRLGDGEPVELETSFIPCSLCPGLTRERLASSLYALIAETSGIMPSRAEQVFEAVTLDRGEARILGVPAGTAALRFLQTTYDSHGKPFEASVNITCADHLKLAVTVDAEGSSVIKVRQ